MAKDFYHEIVKEALTLEGWTITHEPLPLFVGFGRSSVYADIGAEKWIVAEKETEKILVEVKSFLGASNINELHQAVGQIDFYTLLLQQTEPDRIPYLAIPKDAYDDLIREPIIQKYVEVHQVKFLVYNTQKPKIYEWIK